MSDIDFFIEIEDMYRNGTKIVDAIYKASKKLDKDLQSNVNAWLEDTLKKGADNV